MFLLVFSAVFLVVATTGAVRAGLREAGFLRARRSGVELQADVLDNDTSPSGKRGAYFLTPVVRYRLDGRAYTGTVVNASGTPGDRGSAMTIVVSPDRPYEPYDRYGGMGAVARGWLLLFALSLALLVMAIVEF
jgi:hypothetical protein